MIPPYEPPETTHVYYKYVVRLDRNVLEVPAEDFVAALRGEGIHCSRRYPTPLHQQPVFVNHSGFGERPAPYEPPWYPGETSYGDGSPEAERLPEDLVMITMRPTYTENDIQDIAAGVSKVVDYYRSR